MVAVRLEVVEGQVCAIGLYRKLGFKAVSISEGKKREVVMEKKL